MSTPPQSEDEPKDQFKQPFDLDGIPEQEPPAPQVAVAAAAWEYVGRPLGVPLSPGSQSPEFIRNPHTAFPANFLAE